MYPFWDIAILPVLNAVDARRIVEVGALKGDTTTRLLGGLGPDAELHVIDPMPEFDPSEHEQRFPGRYIFHLDISLNVLPQLGAMDAALLDGDHNWYTVYNELRTLRKTSRAARRPLPVCILHDVGFPYGRRDLYYAPERIPPKFRQPHRQAGIVPGQSQLSLRGGLNPQNHNADHEGGPRNGVMTALEDFVAEYDRPVRLVVLPVYFGLAILAEQAVVDAHPALAQVLDRLESAAGREEIAALAEQIRLEGLTEYHNVWYGPLTRLADTVDGYLDLLKGALLNEHYIEQELRMHQLVQSIQHGYAPFGESLREPARRLIAQFDDLRQKRRSGRQATSAKGEVPSYFPLTEMGRVRLDALERSLDAVRLAGVPGDLVDCGTGRGGAAVFMRGYVRAYAMVMREVFVADTFRAAEEGTTSTSTRHDGVPAGGAGFPQLRSDVMGVRDAFSRFDLLDEHVRFLQGPYEKSLRDPQLGQIALLRIGDTAADDAGEILDAAYDAVAPGGIVVVDQYGVPACRDQVEAFRARHGVTDPIERIDDVAISWRKSEASPERDAAATSTAAPVPLLSRLWIGALDLTVAVVFYNMKREAARTLHSLSRAYQQGIDDLKYEVLVIDNGSSPDQRLTEDYVKSFGPEFKLVHPGDEVSPSPAVALSRAVRNGRGRAFALMIDGAHVLTPGVLRYGVAGLHTYAPAVVATQQWYVGPGDQGDAVAVGYDQKAEDGLFDRIGWPGNGYKLFDIGHFIGERDWLDGMWESNCLFVPRELLEQVGGFDERFDEPGGGYANLDLYERLTLPKDVNLVTIIGEGSFHQVHGGTTTNKADHGDRQRAVKEHARHFEELRGKAHGGHNKPLHFVGMLRPEAARTRARRRVLPNLFADPRAGAPTERQPIPRDLSLAFVESYWNSLAWKESTWLGRQIEKAPADLFAYQELISSIRPDWVVETVTGRGGRALYLASICDLVGHGEVLSLDHQEDGDRPEHPRLRYLTRTDDDGATLDAIQAITGAEPRALVILGSRGRSGQTFADFRLLEPLVPVGSYVVFEDTVVNGHPVWAAHGPGPFEAVKGVLGTRDDFAADRSFDRHVPSFNPGGYLKRIR